MSKSKKDHGFAQPHAPGETPPGKFLLGDDLQRLLLALTAARDAAADDHLRVLPHVRKGDGMNNQKLPETEEEWAQVPRPVPLAPDEEDIRLASTTFLKPCPFCGRSGIIAAGEYQRRSGLIGYRVMCPEPRCHASVHSNDHDRDTARRQAVHAWQRRGGAG